VEEVDNQCLEY